MMEASKATSNVAWELAPLSKAFEEFITVTNAESAMLINEDDEGRDISDLIYKGTDSKPWSQRFGAGSGIIAIRDGEVDPSTLYYPDPEEPGYYYKRDGTKWEIFAGVAYPMFGNYGKEWEEEQAQIKYNREAEYIKRREAIIVENIRRNAYSGSSAVISYGDVNRAYQKQVEEIKQPEIQEVSTRRKIRLDNEAVDASPIQDTLSRQLTDIYNRAKLGTVNTEDVYYLLALVVKLLEVKDLGQK